MKVRNFFGLLVGALLFAVTSAAMAESFPASSADDCNWGGYTFQDNMCVRPDCQYDETRIGDGSCVKICDSSQNYVDGGCISKCTGNQSWNGSSCVDSGAGSGSGSSGSSQKAVSIPFSSDEIMSGAQIDFGTAVEAGGNVVVKSTDGRYFYIKVFPR